MGRRGRFIGLGKSTVWSGLIVKLHYLVAARFIVAAIYLVECQFIEHITWPPQGAGVLLLFGSRSSPVWSFCKREYQKCCDPSKGLALTQRDAVGELPRNAERSDGKSRRGAIMNLTNQNGQGASVGTRGGCGVGWGPCACPPRGSTHRFASGEANGSVGRADRHKTPSSAPPRPLSLQEGRGSTSFPLLLVKLHYRAQGWGGADTIAFANSINVAEEKRGMMRV